MTERALPFAIPAALERLTGFNRASHRQQSSMTASSTAGSERGFYRVSGRKITSVLESGGDGYGGGDDHLHRENTLSGTSFYRDSRGFYGGHGGPPSPLNGVVSSSAPRDSGVPITRPSPARTPTITQGLFGPVSGTSRSTPSTPASSLRSHPPLRRPDGLGRSHPSQDGSHTSRFTEIV